MNPTCQSLRPSLRMFVRDNHWTILVNFEEMVPYNPSTPQLQLCPKIPLPILLSTLFLSIQANGFEFCPRFSVYFFFAYHFVFIGENVVFRFLFFSYKHKVKVLLLCIFANLPIKKALWVRHFRLPVRPFSFAIKPICIKFEKMDLSDPEILYL